jgi:hypothetical protein
VFTPDGAGSQSKFQVFGRLLQYRIVSVEFKVHLRRGDRDNGKIRKKGGLKRRLTPGYINCEQLLIRVVVAFSA